MIRTWLQRRRDRRAATLRQEARWISDRLDEATPLAMQAIGKRPADAPFILVLLLIGHLTAERRRDRAHELEGGRVTDEAIADLVGKQ